MSALNDQQKIIGSIELTYLKKLQKKKKNWNENYRGNDVEMTSICEPSINKIDEED